MSRLSKAGIRDFDLLVLSLVLGLGGSLLLIDAPLFPALGEGRFLAGFALITVAFPFGRNVALAIFSKVLGPAEQGEWMGLMFVVGALPRCLGPSWSLYALQLACVAFPEPAPCPPGGRTCLEFAPGQEKRAKFPTSKARISAVFHSFRLIFGRTIISRNGLDAWMLFPERAPAERSR